MASARYLRIESRICSHTAAKICSSSTVNCVYCASAASEHSQTSECQMTRSRTSFRRSRHVGPNTLWSMPLIEVDAHAHRNAHARIDVHAFLSHPNDSEGQSPNLRTLLSACTTASTCPSLSLTGMQSTVL